MLNKYYILFLSFFICAVSCSFDENTNRVQTVAISNKFTDLIYELDSIKNLKYSDPKFCSPSISLANAENVEALKEKVVKNCIRDMLDEIGTKSSGPSDSLNQQLTINQMMEVEFLKWENADIPFFIYPKLFYSIDNEYLKVKDAYGYYFSIAIKAAHMHDLGNWAALYLEHEKKRKGESYSEKEYKRRLENINKFYGNMALTEESLEVYIFSSLRKNPKILQKDLEVLAKSTEKDGWQLINEAFNKKDLLIDNKKTYSIKNRFSSKEDSFLNSICNLLAQTYMPEKELYSLTIIELAENIEILNEMLYYSSHFAKDVHSHLEKKLTKTSEIEGKTIQEKSKAVFVKKENELKNELLVHEMRMQLMNELKDSRIKEYSIREQRPSKKK